MLKALFILIKKKKEEKIQVKLSDVPVNLVSGHILVFTVPSLRMYIILPLDFQAWIDSFSLLVCILP